MAATTTKLRRLERDSGDTLLAWTGEQGAGEQMAEWYAAGADAAQWPATQRDKDGWSRLIGVDASGAWFYEMQPVKLRVEDPFMAWGSGRDFAMAAMHLGKSAREAVEVASVFDVTTGMGVDTLEL